MNVRLYATIVIGGVTAGCATKAQDVASTYVSPIQYSSYTCRQIAEESGRLTGRAATASGAQDEKRSNDNLKTAAAIVIFWPAAFFVGGDDAQTAELARLKGEMEALEQASIQKNCGIQFRRG